METLAIVLAIIFVALVTDLKGEDYEDLSLAVTAAALFGALAIGIYLAVTA